MKKFRDDRELLDGINERNKAAIFKFHACVMEKARSIALHYVKDELDADEIADKAFNNTIQAINNFQHLEAAKKYVYTTVERLSINLLKSFAYRNRPSFPDELPDVRDETDIEALSNKIETLKELKKLIEQLPDNYQLILKLSQEGKNAYEIARMFNKKPQYVHNANQKIIKMLKQMAKLKGLQIFL